MAVTPEASEVADHLTAAQEILFKSAAHSRAFSAEEATNARASAPAIEGTGSGHAEGLGIATSVVRDQMPAEKLGSVLTWVEPLNTCAAIGACACA